MNRHEQSASNIVSASKSLPSAKVIHLPTIKQSSRPSTNAFTQPMIKRIHCSSGRTEEFFWDAGCRGLGIRALKSGRRTWVFQYRDEDGRTRRIALGDVSAVKLEAARDAARDNAASVTKGANPSVDRRARRSAANVFDVIEAYLKQAKERQRPRSYQETERHLRRHAAPLHHDRAASVTRGQIAALLEKVAKQSGSIAANRLRAALSALWTWGIRAGLIETDSNPVAFTERKPEKPRERILNDAELRAIWRVTDGDGDHARIVRLCLLTGCRREEIGGLRWDELESDRIVIATDRMKAGAAHEIPLLPMIAEALPNNPEKSASHVFGRNGTGFSGWSKCKQALDTKIRKAGCSISAWTLHDLRRTFSTRLHDAGVEPLVIEALLAHKQQGVAAVYNRASFRDAKRAALARWHEILKAIVGA